MVTRIIIFGKQIINYSTPQKHKRPIVIFTDTSHGDCPNTKKATGGHNIFMFGSLILIRSFEYHA